MGSFSFCFSAVSQQNCCTCKVNHLEISQFPVWQEPSQRNSTAAAFFPWLIATIFVSGPSRVSHWPAGCFLCMELALPNIHGPIYSLAYIHTQIITYYYCRYRSCRLQYWFLEAFLPDRGPRVLSTTADERIPSRPIVILATMGEGWPPYQLPNLKYVMQCWSRNPTWPVEAAPANLQMSTPLAGKGFYEQQEGCTLRSLHSTLFMSYQYARTNPGSCSLVKSRAEMVLFAKFSEEVA
jgi:hypothetical protein